MDTAGRVRWTHAFAFENILSHILGLFPAVFATEKKLVALKFILYDNVAAMKRKNVNIMIRCKANYTCYNISGFIVFICIFYASSDLPL